MLGISGYASSSMLYSRRDITGFRRKKVAMWEFRWTVAEQQQGALDPTATGKARAIVTACRMPLAGCMSAGVEPVYVRTEVSIGEPRWSFSESRPMKNCVDVVLDPFPRLTPLPTPITLDDLAVGEPGTQCSQRRNLFLSEGTHPISI